MKSTDGEAAALFHVSSLCSHIFSRYYLLIGRLRDAAACDSSVRWRAAALLMTSLMKTPHAGPLCLPVWPTYEWFGAQIIFLLYSGRDSNRRRAELSETFTAQSVGKYWSPNGSKRNNRSCFGSKGKTNFPGGLSSRD